MYQRPTRCAGRETGRATERTAPTVSGPLTISRKLEFERYGRPISLPKEGANEE